MDSITKDPLNLVRGVVKTEIRGRSGLVNDRFSAESRSKTGRGVKPSLISNLRSYSAIYLGLI